MDNYWLRLYKTNYYPPIIKWGKVFFDKGGYLQIEGFKFDYTGNPVWSGASTVINLLEGLGLIK